MVDDLIIYGIIMEWNLGKGQYVTLSVFRDGRARMFTSNSSKDINIRHQNVTNVVKRYIVTASKEIGKMKVFTNHDLPEEEHFKFYFQSNKGPTQGEGYMGDIANETSLWGDLFDYANQVISEMRATSNDFAIEPVQ